MCMPYEEGSVFNAYSAFRFCRSLLLHATHISGDESVAEHGTVKSLRALLKCCGWIWLNKDYSIATALLQYFILPNERLLHENLPLI